MFGRLLEYFSNVYQEHITRWQPSTNGSLVNL